MIRVENKLNHQIVASVSTWGDGKPDEFDVAPGKSEEWNRNDSRGYLMVLKMGPTTLTFFVSKSDTIVVEPGNKVTKNGSTINFLT